MKNLIYLIMTLSLVHCSQGLPPEDPSNNPAPTKQSKELPKEELKDSSKIQVVTFEQIKSMTHVEISENIGTDERIPHFKDFKNWALHELSLDQLESLLFKITVFEHLDNVTPQQIQALDPETAYTALNNYVKCLTPNQTKGLTPMQISGAWAIDFTPAHIAEFNADQINALSTDYLTAEEVQIISPEIIKKIEHRNIPFDRLTRAQVEAVTPEQFSYINEGYDDLGRYNGYGISRFTVEQIPWLTPEQISALPIGAIRGIKPEQLAIMSEEQLQAISIEKSYKFKDHHLKAFSFSQFLLFEENHDIDRIINFIAKGERLFENISEYEYYIQFLIPDNFKHVTYRQALEFSDNFLAVLSPKRIKKMPHYAEVLTPRLIQKDRSEPDKWLLTKEQFQAIPVEQMQDLSLEFLEAMTNEQVYWLTFEQLTHLSKEQLTRLFTIGSGEHTVMNVRKVFSILHIAEQAEEGDQWLRGPMKEAVIKHMEEECEDYNWCMDQWMKFPDLSENKKQHFFSPPPPQPEPIPTTRPYIFLPCDLIQKYFSKRTSN